MKQDRHAGSTELFGKEGRQENLEADDKNERVIHWVIVQKTKAV